MGVSGALGSQGLLQQNLLGTLGSQGSRDLSAPRRVGPGLGPLGPYPLSFFQNKKKVELFTKICEAALPFAIKGAN